MTTDHLRDALGQLRIALAPPEPDGQLLARFLASRDEFAFAALVRRHGPMVLGVCRRVLRHTQDAEDAFQATFLVLARKAAAVRNRAAVGSWLYAVAYRTARRLRDTRARLSAREQQVHALRHPQTGPTEPQDWRPLLDEALSRLPEKHRAPVVLCDLQGLSRREAARQLGLPHGTLSSRLAAGRRRLAQWLSRRGVMLSGGALAALLSEGAACAQVRAALVLATAKAASLVAAGHVAAVAPPVAVLTTGVLRAMWIAKVKVIGAALLVVAALGAGVAYHAEAVGAQQTSPASPAKPRKELEAISGKWAGMGVNSDGNKGTASLLVEEHPDGTLTGKWGAAGSEMTIEKGERVTPHVLHWECSAGIHRYRVRCTMEGKALVITYTLTWKEDGKVNGHTGTGVLVRE